MELIGVPFDLSGKTLGSRLGPAAIRLAGVTETLGKLGIPLKDGTDIPVLAPSEMPSRAGGLRNFHAALDCVRTLKARVSHTLGSGDFPLVVGGDHVIALGAVAGALDAYGDDLAVIWIDAHADVNTPSTSPSGDMHGMPLAALLGLPSGVDGLADKQWQELVCGIVPDTRLRPDRAAWFGLREVDPGEQVHLRNLPGRFAVTMHDVDRHGIVPCLIQFDGWLKKSGAKKLWISFDVDVLDPMLAPGTGTAVRGGISYREMHIFGEVLYEILNAADCPYQLAGLDIVEINPLSDTNNITALTVVEWIASLCGKRILGPRI